MSNKMLFDKEIFLKTEFGREMEKAVRELDLALQQNKQDSVEFGDAVLYLAKWEVYQLAMEQFYGIE